MGVYRRIFSELTGSRAGSGSGRDFGVSFSYWERDVVAFPVSCLFGVAVLLFGREPGDFPFIYRSFWKHRNEKNTSHPGVCPV